jgi:hypothetical protein
MEARGRQGVVHPKVVQVTIQAEEAELSPSAVREPELGGKGGSLREENWHSERKARQNCIDRVPAPSLPVCGEARRYVHARGAGSLKPGERSLAVVIGSAIREAREPIRQRGEARSNRGAKESREERGLLL